MSTLQFPNDKLDAGSVYDVNLGKTQEKINAEISSISESTGEDITSRFTFTSNRRINIVTGEMQGNSSGICKASDYVDIDGFDSIRITQRFTNNTTGASGLCFYDENKQMIKGVNEPSDVGLEKGTYVVSRIPVPEGAKYLRTTWWDDDQEQAAEISFSCIGLTNDGFVREEDLEKELYEIRKEIESSAVLPDYYHDDGYIDARASEILNAVRGESNESGGSGNSEISEVDISSRFTFTENKRINYVNGKLQSTDPSVNPSKASGFVSVEGFTSIKLTMQLLADSSKANGLMFYTSDSADSFIANSGKAYFDDSLANDTYIVREILVPDTAKYVRTTWWNDDTVQASEISFSCIAKNSSGSIVDGLHHGDQFFWFTDPHYFWYSGPSVYNGLNSTKLIKYLQDKTNIRKVFCGGDLVGGTGMKSTTCIRNLQLVKEQLSSIWDNLYMIIGNHEWNNPNADAAANGNMLAIGQIYSLLVKDKEQMFGDVSSRGDYWFDNVPQKIRYFCLGAAYDATINASQVEWFGNELLNVPNGYTVIVLSHVGITKTEEIYSSFSPIVSLLEAAKAKSSYTFDETTFDYNGFSAEIACIICGHIHEDHSVLTDGGIRIISTTCDRGPTNSSSSSSAEFNAVREIGTITEQAIDVFVIDTDAKTVKIFRIGGSFDGTAALQTPDRSFTY